MSNVCSKGHYSSDQDYCSECGVAILSSSNFSAAQSNVNIINTVGAPNGMEKCPECLTSRPESARYCEACRYDFISGSSFSSLSGIAAQVNTPTPIPEVLQPAMAATESSRKSDNAPMIAQRLLIRIVVDPALYTEPDPETPCPVNQAEKIFHLDLDENTLGRQFDGKGVHPEIVIQDPGISRRHLKFVRNNDGTYSVLELGSANGTYFNGNVLEAGVVMPMAPGDQMSLGMWTRILVEAR